MLGRESGIGRYLVKTRARAAPARVCGMHRPQQQKAKGEEIGDNRKFDR